MDQRVDARLLAEPEIEGDVGVARRQVRIVIRGFAVCQMPALGLQADQEVAMGEYRQGNRAAGERGVVSAGAPQADVTASRNGLRKPGEGGFVFGEGPLIWYRAAAPHPAASQPPLPQGEGVCAPLRETFPSPLAGEGTGVRGNAL